MDWKSHGIVSQKQGLIIQRFEVDTIGRVIDLPQDVVDAFKQLAKNQRYVSGCPEDTMREYQKRIGGGVFSNQLEHIGDLTHRLGTDIQYGNINIDSVMEKVHGAVRTLSRGEGFVIEAEGNLRNNAESRGVSTDSLAEKSDEILSRYVEGHKRIPVFNKIQFLARSAAIKLGEQDFAGCLDAVKRLQDELQNPYFFTEQATVVTRNEDGDILSYEQATLARSRQKEHGLER